MKTLLSLFSVLVCSLICFLWIYRGNKIGERENGIKLKQSYTGKVINAYIPKNNKFLRIQLASGLIDTLAFFSLGSLVEAGDSIKKVPNSYKYIIYKKSNPNDTIIFNGAFN